MSRRLWAVTDPLSSALLDTIQSLVKCGVSYRLYPNPELGRHFWDTDLCADPHQYNADLIGIARKPVKNVFYANMFGAFPPKLGYYSRDGRFKARVTAYGEWIEMSCIASHPGCENSLLKLNMSLTDKEGSSNA
jgi:hypothetical protein